MRTYLFSLFFCVAGVLSFHMVQAQDGGASAFGVETNFLAGRVIKHTVKFKAPIPPLTTALDLNFVWKTNGKKHWQQRCNYPQLGVGITYTDYGNNQVFGNCVGIYPNIQIPLLHSARL